MEVTPEGLARFFDVVLPHMNEVQRRVVAGAASEMLGRGGKTVVAAASGMSRNTVIKAEAEVVAGIEPSARLRPPGGGDKPLVDKQPGLLEALDDLVHPDTRGNPMSLLRWTSKSSTKLAEDLVRQGFEVSGRTVLRLLHRLGYSLQANAKVTEGRQHPDRDAQFRYLADMAQGFIDDDQPAISVDTKKKELIGEFANGGAEWAPVGEPERVGVHDFADRALGEFAKAIPYGIYDLSNDEGWVNVGDVADTAEFAVNAIRSLVVSDGPSSLPRRGTAVDHRRCRRLQRISGPGLEGRTGPPGGRDRSAHHGVPLSARHVEVEPDRAPHVQLHHHELAGPAPHHRAHHHRTDLGHDHHHRPHHPSRLRPGLVCHRRQNHRQTTRRRTPPPPRLPRRMELHHRRSINPGVSPKRFLPRMIAAPSKCPGLSAERPQRGPLRDLVIDSRKPVM